MSELRCGLNPNEPVAETIDGDVTVSAIGFGLVIEPGKLSVEATAIMIVVDDYVFAGAKCFGIEVLNGDSVIGWFEPCVKSWWAIGHRSFVPPDFTRV